MLVQVKHRGWVFIQGFYLKNKGNFGENKENKVLNTQQLLLRQRNTPRGQRATIPAPKDKVYTLDRLLEGKNKVQQYTITASMADKYIRRSKSYNTRSEYNNIH